MPAVLAVPVVLVTGSVDHQTLLSIMLGAVNAVLVYLLMKKLKFSERTSLLMTTFFAFGTNHCYLASVGSAWFISHIVALNFMLLAILESFGKRRLWLIGLLLGASFWARTTVIFSLPFFYLIFREKLWPVNERSSSSNKKNLVNFFELNFGVGLFVLVDALYNFVRFGSLSVMAPYLLIPNISADPVFSQGFMSINFISRHLEAVFVRLPNPIYKPSLYSLPIWLTSPALIYALKAGKHRLVLACSLAIILTFGVISLWAGVGYAQFGYRFAQDFMPFLLILVAYGIGQRPSKLAYTLVALSILVNLWGVVMINKLGLYTF
jgi:hypothetical protein